MGHTQVLTVKTMNPEFNSDHRDAARPYFRKVIRAPFAGICSTDIWVVQPQEGVDAGFLFYLMASESFMEPVVRVSEGTKMPRAKWEYAAALELPFPPLPEQRAIAHILGTLDD
jgi:type I restriction enzyme S subunit